MPNAAREPLYTGMDGVGVCAMRSGMGRRAVGVREGCLVRFYIPLISSSWSTKSRKSTVLGGASRPGFKPWPADNLLSNQP